VRAWLRSLRGDPVAAVLVALAGATTVAVFLLLFINS
jgi:hypothetical protein